MVVVLILYKKRLQVAENLCFCFTLFEISFVDGFVKMLYIM